MIVRVYVRRSTKEREVFDILGTDHMSINREVVVDGTKLEEAKSLALLGLVEIRAIIS
jgi:hypothetical protein